jgi:hypothetical protein
LLTFQSLYFPLEYLADESGPALGPDQFIDALA